MLPRMDTDDQPADLRPEDLIDVAVAAWPHDPARHADAVDALRQRARRAKPIASARLDAALGRLWAGGWTPADLAHVVGHRLGTEHEPVVAARVVADGRRREQRGQAIHPGWRRQLAALADRRSRSRHGAVDREVRLLVEVLCLITWLPSLPRTVPAPGEIGSAAADASHLDGALLERVRALLAKAESTEFEEEAEAFSAKAQELMARHAIDEALLHAVDTVGEPSVRRIHLDDPYARARASLIAAVASANRCRTVYSADLRWVTVFGYEPDLDAVELLSASLLVQAISAMVRHGPQRDLDGRSRTRSFRHAFLLGFAWRIGERLCEANDAQMSRTPDADGRLLPVLAARDQRVVAARDRAFSRIVRGTSTISNDDGWCSGRTAAEVADLGPAQHRLPAT